MPESNYVVLEPEVLTVVVPELEPGPESELEPEPELELEPESESESELELEPEPELDESVVVVVAVSVPVGGLGPRQRPSSGSQLASGSQQLLAPWHHKPVASFGTQKPRHSKAVGGVGSPRA